MLVHATCVALKHGRRWRALLLRGPSGAGKSDVALRLLEAGGRLVADDQTRLAKTGRTLVATPPKALAGLIEVRGIGIVKLGRAQLLAAAPVALLVDLVAAGQVERLPETAHETVLGLALPRVALAPFEGSIVAKLRLALARTAAA
jgi:serine kinase of HPr protein (carbohydrate metabolism regulator)